MSTITDSLYVSTSQNNCFDNYYYDNQYCTDYPSPMSSPNSPDLSEISGNQNEGKSNNFSYFSDSWDYCNSPCSTTFSDDIDIDIDTTSERSYTNNNNAYAPLSPLDSSQCEQSRKMSKKRSFSEVEDIDVFSNIDKMNEEEIDNYLNSIDLDLYPKVKSSSELLIFSPLAMKRFKLSDRKSSKGKENNYNCFNLEDDTNTPRIVEITDDEYINGNITQEKSSQYSSNFNTKSPIFYSPSCTVNNNSYCDASPVSSFYNSSLSQQSTCYIPSLKI